MMETENSYRSPDGFKISADLDLTAFLNRPPTDDLGTYEYVHVFPDPESRELRIYRAVGAIGDPKVMTTVPGVVSYRNALGDCENPEGFYLTGGQGETLLTLLRCFRNETTAGELRIEWWGVNNSPIIDDSGIDNESLIVSYETGSGRKEEIMINNSYKNRSHMMASGDSYKFPN